MENLKETISKIIYNDKKVLKSTIKKIDLSELLSLAQELTNTNIIIKNRIILGLVKILVRKFKYLLDDGNELLLKLSHRESIRVVKNKNINLKIESNDYFVTDNFLEEKESVCHDQWMEFGDLSIEAMRDESEGLGSTLIESLVEPVSQLRKKKKIVEDETTEYDAAFYKRTICNKNHTVDNMRVNNLFVGEFKISDVFLQNISLKRNEELSEVEQMRDQTAVDNLNLTDNFDLPFDDIGVDHTSSEANSILETENDFIFNTKVINLTRLEKSKEFLRLLHLAGEGKIKCIQETPFSPILCKKKD